jgi:branched-chain amino acid transport system substrate-binding protein
MSNTVSSVVPERSRRLSGRLVKLSAVPLVAATALTTAVLGLAPLAASANSASPYVIDVVIPLTGPLQTFGIANEHAIRAAATVINAEGGMVGHKIVIHFTNDKGTPTQAVSIAKGYLSSSTKPNYLYAGNSSPEALAVLPLATAAKVLTMQQAVTKTVDTYHKYPYNFTTAPTTAIGYTTLAQAFKAKGYKKAGILTLATSFGSSEAAHAVTRFKKAGIQSKVVTYAFTALSVTPQLETLQAYGPTVLYYVGFGPGPGHILSDLHTLGWNVPTVGSPAVAATNLKGLVPATVLDKTEVEAFTVEQYVAPAKRSKALKACIAALRRQGPIAIPLYNYTFTYDGVMLLYLAAKQANSITTAKMVSALEHLKTPMTKPYVSFPIEAYSPTKHAITATTKSFTFLREGALITGTLQPFSS